MFSSQSNFNLGFTKALVSGHIVPHFQPIISLHDAKIVGFEVLARWNDPVHADISPSDFISFAEKGGLLDKLLETLMYTAFASARRWPEELFLAFNVSPSQLSSPDLLDQIKRVCNFFGFAASRVEIEITETAIIGNPDVALRILRALREIGCRVVLDDFGTGFSSLTWLRTLPFSKIKIDASFVASIHEQRESRKIVAAIIGLGQSLGLSVVAEGIETSNQVELLRVLGCSHGQGYFFSRALPPEEIPEILREALYWRRATTTRCPLSLEQRALQISALYHAHGMSIGFLSADYTVLAASEAFALRLGKNLSEIVGHKFYALLPSNDDWNEWLKQARLSSGPVLGFDASLSSGRTERLLIQKVSDEVGEVMGFSIVGINITP
jgi:EAL domain-containing protein (putative c-di-GMP-specific phosphodiesterase class I)